MIGIANVDFVHVLLVGLIAWAAAKGGRYARPFRSLFEWKTYRWTICDWFDVTFWIAVALAVVRAVSSL